MSTTLPNATSERPDYDAVVIGAGPNGLAAAITLARAGRSVVVFEAGDTIGGGCRTKELTLPGFNHDVCSAIHPLGLASPFMRSLPLDHYGLEWIHPTVPLAHPLLDGTAAVLERSIEATGASFGNMHDALAYRRLMSPLVDRWESLLEGIEAPLRPVYQALHPRTSLLMARFALLAVRSLRGLVENRFESQQARGLLAGMGAHSMLPLEQPLSAAACLVLGTLGHAVGWPLPRGGSQAIVEAMAAYLRALGGKIVTNTVVQSVKDLPTAHAVLCDVTPRQLLRLAGEYLPDSYRQQLEQFRYGPGVCKVDFALDGPVPWTAQACASAGTVHVGGALPDIAASERAAWRGVATDEPFVLVAQSSRFDPTRAPEGKQTLWTYCHVPHGSDSDMTDRIEAQIERFAPGFRDRILARHTFTAVEMERYNPNYVGGDINGGVQDATQLFTRPTIKLDIANPYATPTRGLYICSSSTPPGGGVHGMCGYYAAHAALRTVA